MRRLIVKALVVLAMGLYSLSTAPNAYAASGGPSCGLNVLICDDHPPQTLQEFCLTVCGTPYYTCMNDPYQPYGPNRLYCSEGADQ